MAGSVSERPRLLLALLGTQRWVDASFPRNILRSQMFPKWIQAFARWPPTGLGLIDLGSEGALVGPRGCGQDGVQGPGEYFGLDPWGSVQEVTSPSTSVSHSKRRLRQPPPVTGAGYHCWGVLYPTSPAQPSARPRCTHVLAFSRLREPGHPQRGSSGCWSKTGGWSLWDPSSRIRAACSRL